MARVNKTTSPYYTTNVKGFYLDLWDAPELQSSVYDKNYKIEPKYDKRPDLLAYELYGSAGLWWIFALKNKDILIDPVEDFRSGVTIVTPAKASVEGLT